MGSAEPRGGIRLLPFVEVFSALHRCAKYLTRLPSILVAIGPCSWTPYDRNHRNTALDMA